LDIFFPRFFFRIFSVKQVEKSEFFEKRRTHLSKMEKKKKTYLNQSNYLTMNAVPEDDIKEQRLSLRSKLERTMSFRSRSNSNLSSSPLHKDTLFSSTQNYFISSPLSRVIHPSAASVANSNEDYSESSFSESLESSPRCSPRLPLQKCADEMSVCELVELAVDSHAASLDMSLCVEDRRAAEDDCLCFFLAHKLFVGTGELINMLLQRYKTAMRGDDQVRGGHVLDVLGRWYSFDERFNQCHDALVSSFAEHGGVANSAHRNRLMQALKVAKMQRRVAFADLPPSFASAADVDERRAQRRALLSMPAEHAARYLARAHTDVLGCVTPWAMLHDAAADQACRRATDHFNAMAAFVQTSVMLTRASQKAAKIVARWIAIAEQLAVLGTFDCLAMITGALDHVSVSRLTGVWSHVPRELRATLAALVDFLSPRGNFKQLRAAVAAHPDATLPLFVLCKDALFMRETLEKPTVRQRVHFVPPRLGTSLSSSSLPSIATPSLASFVASSSSSSSSATAGAAGAKKEQDIYVRYRRIAQLAHIAFDNTHYRRNRFQLPLRVAPRHDLLLFLSNPLPRLSEEKLWKRSYIIEPSVRQQAAAAAAADNKQQAAAAVDGGAPNTSRIVRRRNGSDLIYTPNPLSGSSFDSSDDSRSRSSTDGSSPRLGSAGSSPRASLPSTPPMPRRRKSAASRIKHRLAASTSEPAVNFQSQPRRRAVTAAPVLSSSSPLASSPPPPPSLASLSSPSKGKSKSKFKKLFGGGNKSKHLQSPRPVRPSSLLVVENPVLQEFRRNQQKQQMLLPVVVAAATPTVAAAADTPSPIITDQMLPRGLPVPQALLASASSSSSSPANTSSSSSSPTNTSSSISSSPTNMSSSSMSSSPTSHSYTRSASTSPKPKAMLGKKRSSWIDFAKRDGRLSGSWIEPRTVGHSRVARSSSTTTLCTDAE
jgi:RasGEF domain